MGCDPLNDRVDLWCRISIHAPQWGATSAAGSPHGSRSYFNPRTPVGCDESGFVAFHHHVISIHAPQWGATYGATPVQIFLFISIHAPQWGATRRAQVSTHTPFPFQSTHPSGVRLTRRHLATPCIYFNPRTPVGCDPKTPPHSTTPSDFNPRTPVGCDSSGMSRSRTCVRFQSTHPSGVRHPTRQHAQTRSRNFNPRTPVGCDPPPSRRR